MNKSLFLLPFLLSLLLISYTCISCNITLSGKIPQGRFSITQTVPAKSGDSISSEDVVRVSFSHQDEAEEIRTVLTLSDRNGEVGGSWDLSGKSWIFNPKQPFQKEFPYYLIIRDPESPRRIRFTYRPREHPPVVTEIEAFGYFSSLNPETPILTSFAEGASFQLAPGGIPCIDFSDNFSQPAPVETWITTDPPIEGDWYLHESILRFYPSPSFDLPKKWLVLVEGTPILSYLVDLPLCTLEEVTISGEGSITVSAPFEETDPVKLENTSADGGLALTLLFSSPLLDQESRETLLDRLSINPIYPTGSPYPVLTGFQWLTDRTLFLNYRNFVSNPPGKVVLYRVSLSPAEDSPKAELEPEGLTFLIEVGP